MSKIIGMFLNFFFIEKYQFRSTFVDNINFWITLLLKWCPIFDSSPLHQFSKFNNFHWVCWFVGKTISIFLSPDLKLHNRYCHNFHTQGQADLLKLKEHALQNSNCLVVNENGGIGFMIHIRNIIAKAWFP